MSFDDILEKIVEPSAALGAALMGSDGIPIAQVEGASTSGATEDQVSVLSVEFGRILAECQKVAHSTEAGQLEEISVQMEQLTAILRHVDEDTYLVVVIGAEANAGRARFDIRRHLVDLRAQL